MKRLNKRKRSAVFVLAFLVSLLSLLIATNKSFFAAIPFVGIATILVLWLLYERPSKRKNKRKKNN